MTGTGHRIAGLCAYALVERGALLLTTQPLETWSATQLTVQAANAGVKIPATILLPVFIGLLIALNVLFVLLGSLIPDLDHPDSTIAHMLGPLWRFAFRFLRFITRETLVGELFEHRGPSHSLAWWLAVNIPLAMLAALLAPALLSTVFAFAIGWLSHPFADGITKEGVKLFWPLSQVRLHLVPELLAARTGAWSETAYLGIFTLLTLVAWGVPALVEAIIRS
jgi:inner membrane protein